MARAALILNPVAGQGRLKVARDRLMHIMSEVGLDCRISLTEQAGDGLRLAREAAGDGYDLVVAVGGDGTVNEVVNGLAGLDTPLGILPLGSVNVLARELAIPLDLPRAARVLVDGTLRRIDLGMAAGRYFTLMAGFGFDAEVVSNVRPPVKDIIGPSAYVLKSLEALTYYQATDISIEMDGRTFQTKAFAAIIGNSSMYAYPLKVTPHACMDDGLLDICIFERPMTDRIGFLHQMVDIFRERHLHHPDVQYFRARHVVIESEPEIMMQLDGDIFGTTPAEVSIIPRSLPLMVPYFP
ncbi:MAG: diacylglycerol kinase family lipid kinase [bacterium]|jgi:diacylglycerol kinase (ATP)|nr:diacylglycerol kinase family lipid kinase [bacterium]MDD3804838.1 diacylglycerol kinase family lipid kinase [bacterium]MDD4152874.1 diacylglycerol kinase family lipid kinase [bacterium]MDD4558408.1 diacylglycerol kinase family lipid kinase [bacterium]